LPTEAGRESEEELLGASAGGDGDDLRQIAHMFEQLPIAVGDTTLNERRLRAKTRGIVRRHRETIERVARHLMARRTLSAETIDEMIPDTPASLAVRTARAALLPFWADDETG
jgi:hypothetical protein